MFPIFRTQLNGLRSGRKTFRECSEPPDGADGWLSQCQQARLSPDAALGGSGLASALPFPEVVALTLLLAVVGVGALPTVIRAATAWHLLCANPSPSLPHLFLPYISFEGLLFARFWLVVLAQTVKRLPAVQETQV